MKLQVEINGSTYTAEAEKIRGQTWVHLNGKTFLYATLDEQNQKLKSKKKSHAGDLLAPMPGKVTKILKSAGEKVTKSEAVLVMEAMKMEYTLKADGDGQIEKINVQVGDQVQLGKLLVHIKI